MASPFIELSTYTGLPTRQLRRMTLEIFLPKRIYKAKEATQRLKVMNQAVKSFTERIRIGVGVKHTKWLLYSPCGNEVIADFPEHSTRFKEKAREEFQNHLRGHLVFLKNKPTEKCTSPHLTSLSKSYSSLSGGSSGYPSWRG